VDNKAGAIITGPVRPVGKNMQVETSGYLLWAKREDGGVFGPTKGRALTLRGCQQCGQAENFRRGRKEFF